LSSLPSDICFRFWFSFFLSSWYRRTWMPRWPRPLFSCRQFRFYGLIRMFGDVGVLLTDLSRFTVISGLRVVRFTDLAACKSFYFCFYCHMWLFQWAPLSDLGFDLFFCEVCQCLPCFFLPIEVCLHVPLTVFQLPSCLSNTVKGLGVSEPC